MNSYMRMTVAAGLVLGCTIALAQNKAEDHAAHHPAGDPVSEPSAMKQPAPMTMEQMQGNMKTMREQMSRINGSKDPVERKALMDQHMQAMHRNMDTMQAMMGASKSAGTPGAQDSGGMMNCGKMVDGTMNMMQMMMEQMQQHANAEQKPR